jgi:4-hydroxy-3-methylbut-2-enyl diphosphate reductase
VSDLIIATPLRVEQAAARRRAAGATVVRTGMGRGASERSRGRLAGRGPLAVLGLAGGLSAEVRPGDVVVASEVRDGATVVSCPTAPVLAGALRRLGLVVHVGPIATVAKVADGPRRAELAATGAIAVDMESGYLLAGSAGRVVAAVRVIVDTDDQPFWRLGTAARGIRALGVLRRAVPAVVEWAGAAGDREAVLAAPRSMCAGVTRAIDIVERAVERFGAPVYVRRQIVHNSHVVSDLESRGAVFVTELDEVPQGANVVLAAHGVAPAVWAQARARELAVVDATCPLVAKVHQEVRRFAAAGDTVLLIGHSDHEEVVGTVGEAPDRVRVIADEDEAWSVTVDDPDHVAYVTQTTLAVEQAETIAGILRERFPRMSEPRHDDICYATSNRQRAVREIAAECDLVLVVGSANSSNSRRLVEVARGMNTAAYLVDDATGVQPRWLAGVRRVGLTAGASAPDHLVAEIAAALEGFGNVAVREHHAVEENVHFALPKEVV